MSVYENNNCAYTSVALQLSEQGRQPDEQLEDKFWQSAFVVGGYERGTPMPEDVFALFCQTNTDVAILVITQEIRWVNDRATYEDGASRLYCNSDTPQYFICLKRQNVEPAHWAVCTTYDREELAYICKNRTDNGISLWGPGELPMRTRPAVKANPRPCQLCEVHGDVEFHPEEECAWANL
jgi:hypothetical protein